MSAWHVSLVRSIKNTLVPRGLHARTILAGPFKGIRMDLNLRTQSQFYFGLFERELHPWIVRFSQNVRSVVDVGAADGEYTLFALIKTKAKDVITFEPDPSMVIRIRRNLEHNSVASSRLRLHNLRLDTIDSPCSMSVRTLSDSVLTPCMVKMDIDGGEANVLHAALSCGLLDRRGLRWIIETHSRPLEDECLAIFKSRGYAARIIPNAWWRLFVPEQRAEHTR